MSGSENHLYLCLEQQVISQKKILKLFASCYVLPPHPHPPPPPPTPPPPHPHPHPHPHPLHWYLDSWVMKHQCDTCMMLEMAWRTRQLQLVLSSGPVTHTKASDAELWCFIWSAPSINGWVNNRKAGDLRRHCAHYDVILMWDYFYQHSKLIIEILWKLFLCNSYINDTIRSPHSVKLVSPQSLTDEKVAGPVKNIGGPINLLYKTMSKIGKKL